jgi:hypothetical protein
MFEARETHCRLLLLVGVAMTAAILMSSAQNPVPFQPTSPARPDPQTAPQDVIPPTPPMTEKQKKDLLKYNFGQMKKDAQELSSLAKSLQDDLEHSNQNVLSIGVISKAEKIEKLAKKIRDSAKGLPDRAEADPSVGGAATRTTGRARA